MSLGSISLGSMNLGSVSREPFFPFSGPGGNPSVSNSTFTDTSHVQKLQKWAKWVKIILTHLFWHILVFLMIILVFFLFLQPGKGGGPSAEVFKLFPNSNLVIFRRRLLM